MAELLAPYGNFTDRILLQQLLVYLDLLLRWNERTNLTSIRDVETIVQRHFGESLFAGRLLPPEAVNLLDFGSGAGFPGLPIQLLCPDLRVNLAESQHKKAAFLSEVVRTLALPTEVWSGRVEALPPGRVFDVVTLRAVDKPDAALALARERLAEGGVLVHLTTDVAESSFAIPGTRNGRVVFIR